MNNIIIIQARLNSKRLPFKVLFKIGNKRIVDLIYDRIKSVKTINDIIKKDNRIDVIINNAGVSIFSKYDKRTDLELDKTIDTNIKGLLNVINSYVYVHKKYDLKTFSPGILKKEPFFIRKSY